MDIRKIKKLIDLLDETGVTEIEITEGEESVRISRAHQNTLVSTNSRFNNLTQQSSSTHNDPMPAMLQPQSTTPTSTSTPPPMPEPIAQGTVVHSPMVGTAYLASTPEAKSFVEIGQKVSIGDTLCLIEAMKMYNPIEADCAGTVISRLIENGQPVEFDQPLFVIEES
jgi:acetyl-CoA carboxylase biotin carboxyl carrier protein